LDYHIDIDDITIPLRIIEERRNGARVSFGATHVILRVPKVPFFGSNIPKHVEWAKTWLKQLKATKPHVFNKYTNQRKYEDGQSWSVGKHQFTLSIRQESQENGSIKITKDRTLKIVIPNRSDYDQQKLIRSLLIKFAQKYFLPTIIERVNHYNQNYFKQKINGVRLKYNKSNWGSCSTGRNLNFSVRLFFAPDDVIDYVVIHELAHLIEMNHSDRFWKIVADIMPDYELKEKMLKLNSAHYEF
jgi:predicted metal-dependent hydrolase